MEEFDEFAEKLRRLELSGPSPALDQRVDGVLRGGPASMRRHGRVVGLRWAAVAAIAMGMLGVVVGRKTAPVPDNREAGAPAPSGKAYASVQIIYERTPHSNPFDMTTAANDGLRPDLH